MLSGPGGDAGREAADGGPREAHPAGDRGRILVILHQERSTTGRVGPLLAARGFRLDIRRPALGDSLPKTLEGHAAAIVFGGPMSANDPDAFIKREIDFIDVPLAENKPFLGICLGAQMLAKAIGGRVTGHPRDLVEIGYYDLHPTAAGLRLRDWPRKVYQWHREGFDIAGAGAGTGAEILANGEHFEHQVFRVGAAYGVQFHPELTLAMMYRWTTLGSARMQQPGARHRRDHFAGRALFDPAVRSWFDRFLDVWLGPAATAEPPATAATTSRCSEPPAAGRGVSDRT
jgi:GMP synthase (glutamine-hydrolysing)